MQIQNHIISLEDIRHYYLIKRFQVSNHSALYSYYVDALKLPKSIRIIKNNIRTYKDVKINTCVIKNFVTLSGNRPLSWDNIISNISPRSFSIMTKIRSGVSNIRSKLTTPGCDKFCSIATSFFNWASCLVGNRNLSIT